MSAEPAAVAADPLDLVALPWWESLLEVTGPLELFDAHTHIGQNDPDNYKQAPAELLAGLDRADARGVVFPMCEPDGYRAANDEVLALAAGSGDRLVPFCRVNPNLRAVAEAERALAAGARGIKLHPRAEGFTLSVPAVAELVALADERRLPVLIHAGRGIPALGRDTVTLAERHPEAQLILAHAAVSDLSWLWRELPAHPNLFIDTSWWSPGDMISLFTLAPPGRILWASDSPYGQPLSSAVMALRFAIQVGLGPEAIRSIAGAQVARLLAGEELLDPPPASGEAEPYDPILERIVTQLVAGIGVAVAGEEPHEFLALARLACDVGEGPLEPICAALAELIDRAGEHFPQPEERRFELGARFMVFAMTVARTPRVAWPR